MYSKKINFFIFFILIYCGIFYILHTFFKIKHLDSANIIILIFNLITQKAFFHLKEYFPNNIILNKYYTYIAYITTCILYASIIVSLIYINLQYANLFISK